MTSFEVFEHLQYPLVEINKMIEICPNILFSTELLPIHIPKHDGKDAWWYYSFTHGQHISFYSIETLLYIAKQNNLNLCSSGNIHLLSKQKINKTLFKLIIKLSNRGLFKFITKKLHSKTIRDSAMLIKNYTA